MGLPLAGPSGDCLGLLTLRWLACLDPVTDASGFLYRPSFDGGLGWCTGAVSFRRRHLPLRVGGRHARVPCGCACARPSWPGRAGQPPGRVLVRLTFSSGRSVFLLCSAPSVLGLPLSWSSAGPPLVSPPLPPPSFFFLFFLFRARPLSLAFFGFRPGSGLGALFLGWFLFGGFGFLVLDATHGPPAAKRRQKRRGSGTGKRGRYMVNKRGHAGARAGAWRVTNFFYEFYALLPTLFSLRRR